MACTHCEAAAGSHRPSCTHTTIWPSDAASVTKPRTGPPAARASAMAMKPRCAGPSSMHAIVAAAMEHTCSGGAAGSRAAGQQLEARLPSLGARGCARMQQLCAKPGPRVWPRA